jgi:hypothetical protein
MEINSNGRINLLSQDTNKLFSMTDRIHIISRVADYSEAMTGNWSDTLLSTTYFSSKNIKIIQNGIRIGVFQRSNGQYTIGIQDCDSLKIIMRSVFLQHSANKPDNIPEQINELNKIVLNYCIQQVYSEAEGYMKYIYDVSTLVVPISHPVMPNNTDKQLEFKKWF